MYQRFLNNHDYISIVTEEALQQLIRGNEDRLAQAEEAAEASILEYLTDNYEVEKELEIGKQIMPYNDLITYPVGSHFYHENKICEAIRSIGSRKIPTDKVYWQEFEYDEQKIKQAIPYSQIKSWQPGDIVAFANTYFECMEYNGLDYNDIQIPGFKAWEKVEVYGWEPNVPYNKWDVVSFDGKFYTLTNDQNVDQTQDPYTSDNWGLIGTYSADYNYEFTNTEYVVCEGNVYYPIKEPSAGKLVKNFNFNYHDPRNSNIKKHMLRLSVYELYKLISPNNVSSARITDYEASLAWLRDANRLKINPNIPRKLDEENHPVTEYAIATFARDYDAEKNIWQI